ncbi:MAG: hypothetical protein ACFE8L_08320 [Candidatus Hodarchaeota archaeon]
MIEISLEEFEDFYKKRINSQFSKIKKATHKLITDVRENLVEIKVCMDHFIKSGEGKIDGKAQKSLHFFSDRMRKEIDEIEIPDEEIYYDNVNDLLNSIKRLFPTINEIARKAFPKFKKEMQAEIKELDYITRKLGKKQGILGEFLRKKYTDIREAEELLKKLPKLFSLRDHIEKTRIELDDFENQYEEKQEALKKLNTELIEIEKNQLFKNIEEEEDYLFRLRLKINDEIGFKKALKKLKFELEKGTIHVPNIDLNYLKDFLKNPIKMLSNERKDLPKFTTLMVQLRHSLEENKLNLKSETKEKTIEQINAIFDEKELQTNIENYTQVKEKVEEIRNKIEEAGLAQKLDDLKNQISIISTKIEHIENDKNRKNKDYTRYLSNLKDERETFQNMVEQILNEPVKIDITFSF